MVSRLCKLAVAACQFGSEVAVVRDFKTAPPMAKINQRPSRLPHPMPGKDSVRDKKRKSQQASDLFRLSFRLWVANGDMLCDRDGTSAAYDETPVYKQPVHS